MFAVKRYTSKPPFCFIFPFYLWGSSVKTGTSFGQHLKMSERMFFDLKARPTAWSLRMFWIHLIFILFPFLIWGLPGLGISNQHALYTMLPWVAGVKRLSYSCKMGAKHQIKLEATQSQVIIRKMCSISANSSPLLSVKSRGGTFGQESLFPFWQGNQRVPWPDRSLTADQTGWVPLEWHLEPLQGMRAPLISSHLVRTTVCQG